MAIGRATRWALAAFAMAAAAVAVATPVQAERADMCFVKTKRCCFDPHVCGVVTKKHVQFVKYMCLKKMNKKIRVPCKYGGHNPIDRMAEVPDTDADNAAIAINDAAAPADAANAESASPAVPDVVSRRSYTYKPPPKKFCYKTVTIAYRAKCEKKVVRIKYYPKICFKKKCTVEFSGRGRGHRKAPYVDYKNGVDEDKVGKGGAQGYFHRTLGY
ncbi:hypothetical protein MMPV_006383 [Pyropia vietnamensis]